MTRRAWSRSSEAVGADDPLRVKGATAGRPRECLLLVRRSHDASADPGDKRFSNRIHPAAKTCWRPVPARANAVSVPRIATTCSPSTAARCASLAADEPRPPVPRCSSQRTPGQSWFEWLAEAPAYDVDASAQSGRRPHSNPTKVLATAQVRASREPSTGQTYAQDAAGGGGANGLRRSTGPSGARTRMPAVRRSREGSSLQPHSRCGATSIEPRLTENVLRGHFRIRRGKRKASNLQALQ